MKGRGLLIARLARHWLLVLLLLATLSATAEARPRTSEAALRSLETRLLGPEHAAKHAAQRAKQRLQQRRPRMSPAALRSSSARHTRASGAPAAGPPAEVGEWYEPGPRATPFLLPDYAIHAALLPTGKVILWGYPVTPPRGKRRNVGNAWLWDPAAGYASNAFKQVAPPDKAPIYCSGMSLLANGNLFITGGNLKFEDKGLNKTFTFDPFKETWHRQGDMGHGRWYPGQVVLPDGRVAILGGYTERGSTQDNPQFEVWPRRDRASPSDTDLDAERLPVERISSGDRTTATYPHLFVTPGGRVLLAGPGAGDSALLDLRTFTWSDPAACPAAWTASAATRCCFQGAPGCCRSAATTSPRSTRRRPRARHPPPCPLPPTAAAAGGQPRPSPSAARTGIPSCCPTGRW